MANGMHLAVCGTACWGETIFDGFNGKFDDIEIESHFLML